MWTLNSVPGRACFLLLATMTIGVVLALPVTGVAQTRNTLVIQSDLGGRVGARAVQILKIRSSGQKVRIVGPLCMSSCTMYLGAGDVCISPNTTFGFHGPSFYGVPLDESGFEYWSDVISSFYTTPLRNWYMKTARYTTSKVHRISGAQLIRMGYSQC